MIELCLTSTRMLINRERNQVDVIRIITLDTKKFMISSGERSKIFLLFYLIYISKRDNPASQFYLFFLGSLFLYSLFNNYNFFLLLLGENCYYK
uniref:Uncharacterized protein n=1 Tax=Solanum lycopersicum TaxID=4081 RepID=A0A3Q7IGV4_SOLLC